MIGKLVLAFVPRALVFSSIFKSSIQQKQKYILKHLTGHFESIKHC